MPKMFLTTKAIEKIAPPDEGQVDYFDTAIPAFGLRVGKTTRRYFVITRINGKRARITVGDTVSLTLSKAREKASDIIEQAREGHDPRQQRKAEVAANRQRAANTFSAVADLYIERYAMKAKRTWEEDRRILDMYFKPLWEDTPITEITKADISAALDKIEDGKIKGQRKGGIYQANRAIAVLRKMFNWAMDDRGLIDAVPIGKNMKRGVEGSRKRAFTDDEIKAIWNAADSIGGFKGNAVKMLMLTGQRSGVVRGMKFSEIDGDVWTIPGDATGRSKNKLDHIVPLPSQALAVIDAVPCVEGKDHVFGTGKAGDKPLVVGSKLAEEIAAKCGFSDWCFQNLRGLVATRMKRPLNIPSSIIDRVQGRLDQSVLARNYDANDYLEDKRAALQTWANYLDALVNDRDADNVVDMMGGAR